MNEEIIIKMVEPYLKESSLTYEEFDNLFEMLSLKEQYGVLDILEKNNISLRPDEEEDEPNIYFEGDYFDARYFGVRPVIIVKTIDIK